MKITVVVSGDHRAGAAPVVVCGVGVSGGRDYGVGVTQRTGIGASADLNPVVIEPAAEVDLPGIVEVLNYVAANSHVSFDTQGVGSLLYRALFECLADEPVHVFPAGIAMPNDASVALHRKFGFTEVGTFGEYAVKNGQYINSLWMQRLSPTADQAG
ncbi:GNAT family N-acetyltransferase [Micromonospora sp. NBC_01796]|uniref:GNAT family N-acetyltransferase n=1 Tax=Micromonospora sp. NBC_01796 TaxID=2975987 RepID=UPI002DD9B582|nr:GNAT family N-acetyltransferase [Micromonospora sp. NBC_01796]WSA85745.1 GNAT family N-acetyltransferase [Micromonospora sp. NBC_01796]